MALKTTVMVNNITHLSEARYCAGMGVNILGFQFDGSEESTRRFNEISSWIAGVGLCGDFRGADVSFIENTLSKHPLSYVQFDDPSNIGQLTNAEVELILHVHISEAEQLAKLDNVLKQYADKLAYINLECEHEKLKPVLFNWLSGHAISGRVLIGFGFDATNVLSVVENHALAGIMMYGTEEERPGFHEYGELMDVLEALED